MQAPSNLILLLLFFFPAKRVKGQQQTDVVVKCKSPDQIEPQKLAFECHLNKTDCDFNNDVACYLGNKFLPCVLKKLEPRSDGGRTLPFSSVEISNATVPGIYDVNLSTDCGDRPIHRFNVTCVRESPKPDYNTKPEPDQTLTKVVACVGCVLGAALVGVLVVLGIRRKKRSTTTVNANQQQQQQQQLTSRDCEVGAR